MGKRRCGSTKETVKTDPRTIAVYPGSFDPVHNGHLDIVLRARGIFGRIIVGVADNLEKTPLFSTADRVAMMRDATKGHEGVEVRPFEGLTVEFVHRVGARVIVKGLRAVMDFDFELKMAEMNKRLRPEIETFFLMTSPECAYLSSTLIREVARFGGSLTGLVPPEVEHQLARKFKSRRGRGDENGGS
jgi:pantetheine-phosphate adenylyltransferase